MTQPAASFVEFTNGQQQLISSGIDFGGETEDGADDGVDRVAVLGDGDGRFHDFAISEKPTSL